MKACDRVWEVEAVRDGRLSDGDRARAIAHRERCAVCTAEVGALEALGERLRATRPAPDDLALRRVRNAVLARVSRTAAPRPASRRWVYAASAAAVAAGIGLVELTRWTELDEASTRSAGSGPDAPSTSIGATEAVLIESSDGGIVSRISEGTIDRMILSDGRFVVDVRRHTPGRQLIFVLPDAELEDLGTRFEVVVRSGRTTSIVVHEGAIGLRRGRHEELRLTAGSSWHPAPDFASSAVAPTPVAPPVACVVPAAPEPPASPPHGAGSTSATPSARAPSPSAERPGHPTPSPPTSASPNPPASSAVDAMAEDEAYLHVIALLREGRDEEARLAARAYLRRFPDGLRRTEVAGIAR